MATNQDKVKEHIEFFEAVFVQQHGDSFPGCIFTLFVLRFDPFFASAQFRLIS